MGVAGRVGEKWTVMKCFCAEPVEHDDDSSVESLRFDVETVKIELQFCCESIIWRMEW